MKRLSLVLLAAVWALIGLGTSATSRAATIDVRHSTLEKLLTDSAQPGGRKFLSGKEGDPCGWSYVRSPKVETTGHRIRLSAYLRGAFALGGGCLKIPEELPVELIAEPVYGNGILSLANPEIHVQGELAGRISSVLLGSMLKLVRLPLQEKILDLMIPSQDGIVFKLVSFDVSRLEVLMDRIRLTVSFGVEVQ